MIRGANLPAGSIPALGLLQTCGKNVPTTELMALFLPGDIVFFT
jgi:hypothetical protein